MQSPELKPVPGFAQKLVIIATAVGALFPNGFKEEAPQPDFEERLTDFARSLGHLFPDGTPKFEVNKDLLKFVASMVLSSLTEAQPQTQEENDPGGLGFMGD